MMGEVLWEPKRRRASSLVSNKETAKHKFFSFAIPRVQEAQKHKITLLVAGFARIVMK
jgi:hypothetical protein